MQDTTSDIQKAISFVKAQMQAYDSSHDWQHIKRVWKLAKLIGRAEKANMRIVELAALLHDVGDHKFHEGEPDAASRILESFLNNLNLSQPEKMEILQIVENVSFSKKNKSGYHSLELEVVQDADRLDAIGAIGIARTFHFGGHKGFPICTPEAASRLAKPGEDNFRNGLSTIDHFFEKLLLLKDQMNTVTAREISEERHQFLEGYLDQFFKEWQVGG